MKLIFFFLILQTSQLKITNFNTEQLKNYLINLHFQTQMSCKTTIIEFNYKSEESKKVIFVRNAFLNQKENRILSI